MSCSVHEVLTVTKEQKNKDNVEGKDTTMWRHTRNEYHSKLVNIKEMYTKQMWFIRNCCATVQQKEKKRKFYSEYFINKLNKTKDHNKGTSMNEWIVISHWTIMVTFNRRWGKKTKKTITIQLHTDSEEMRSIHRRTSFIPQISHPGCFQR